MKLLNKFSYANCLFLFGCFILFSSCEKNDRIDILSDDGLQARMAYTEKGYTEVVVTPIVKIDCYFENWDKTIMTPVSGLFEYYDSENNWVASIDFGNGTCDEWATKIWDVTIFPDYPDGSEDFSVFSYKKKKIK